MAAEAAATAADKPFTPTVTSIDGQSLSWQRQQQQQQQQQDASSSRNNLGHHCSPVRVISFTDGEYIFGPFDERSREFEQFEFLSSKFAPRPASTCSPVNGSFGDTGPSDHQHDGEGRSGSNDEADDGAGSEDDQQKIATEQHHPDGASYGRWARFENGNISPTAQPPPTCEGPDSHEAKRLTRGDEIEEIFQQLNQTLKENVTRPEPAVSSDDQCQLVENVPVIESILDDLLTFSRRLDQDPGPGPGHETFGAPHGANRADAPLTEMNDDNLINLLADDGDNEGDTGARHNATDGDKSRNGCGPGASIERSPSLLDGEPNEKRSINNGEVDNQFHRVTLDNAPARQQEDIFTNVAIFNWNALDAYQQHGLFMIDPRFALADMRAMPPVAHDGGAGTMSSLPTVPEEPAEQLGSINDNSAQRAPPGVSISTTAAVNDPVKNDSAAPVTLDGINNSTIVTVNAEVGHRNAVPAATTANQPYHGDGGGCQPVSCDRNVNTCHNDRDHEAHDGSDKIVQMNQLLHFYDACHVRYPCVVSCTAAGTPHEHRTANMQEHDIRDGHVDVVDGSRMPVTTDRSQAEVEEGTPSVVRASSPC
uniref:Uncharacterized protein n=1 Tax=Anopheles albimanus TaxID=7167 RepID=A0A182FD71_ANOAL